MQQIIIGTKNQIVIPKEMRKKIKGLKPGRKVNIYSLDENTIAIKVEKNNWLDNSYGLMQKAWVKNPLKELNNLREEWI